MAEGTRTFPMRCSKKECCCRLNTFVLRDVYYFFNDVFLRFSNGCILYAGRNLYKVFGFYAHISHVLRRGFCA